MGRNPRLLVPAAKMYWKGNDENMHLFRKSLMIFLLLLMVLLSSGKPGRAAESFDLYPLLFRRPDGQVTQAQTSQAQIMIVGDVSMARGVADTIAAHQGDSDYPLNAVRDRLHSIDLVAGNYEGVIAPDAVGTQRVGGYRLRADPGVVVALARAGFGLLNLANNHTLDDGPEGLHSTLDVLHAQGLQTVGAGQDASSARQPLITTIHGVRIAWVSAVAASDPADESIEQEGAGYGRARFAAQQLIESIHAARQLADTVIVQLHWGTEYATRPTVWQQQIARDAIDAGAALVVGHHPHVIQTVETYHDALIVYSLGNFLFDQDQRAGLALWVRLDAQGIVDVRGLTVHPGVHPTWDDPARSASALHDICGTVGWTGFQFANGSYQAVTLRSNQVPVRTSTLDMRGDGQQEQVTLDDAVLRIHDGDQIVYESHPSWQVVDYTVGDPNQDGRFEVLMLLWKQDTPGAPVTTHPFIVGYRKGAYKVIWGGSATSNWVQALTVADVDGDQLDELVTLERDMNDVMCSTTTQVVVMAWNGWGFTRHWTSAPAAFSSVRVDGATPPTILAGEGR